MYMTKETINLNQISIDQIPDSEVLTASLQDPSRFEVLVYRYQKEFMRKIFRIVKDKDVAEDIVQETFIKIYKNAEKYKLQEGATFKSWAYAVLTNTCYTFLKKEKKKEQFLALADSDMLDIVSGDANDTEKKLDLNQALSALNKIPSMLARMITLALAGKTPEEIAKIEGVSEGVVRTRIHRAKAEVRKYIS